MLRQFSRPGKKWLRLLHFLCIIKYVSLISLLHIPPNFQGGMLQGVNITLPVCWNGRRGGLKILWWRHRVGSSPTTGTKIRVIPYGMTRIFYACAGTRTIKCKCPVDICSIPAGRNRHHNVTSPTTGAAKAGCFGPYCPMAPT